MPLPGSSWLMRICFAVPGGVGKTTCARIFAKTINCLHPTENMEACGDVESYKSFAEGRSYSIHELDAASNNSVDDIRELLDRSGSRYKWEKIQCVHY